MTKNMTLSIRAASTSGAPMPTSSSKVSIKATNVPKPSAKQSGAAKATAGSNLHERTPEALVRTWMWMLSVSTDREFNVKGRNCLIDNFGSIDAAIKYLQSKRV